MQFVTNLGPYDLVNKGKVTQSLSFNAIVLGCHVLEYEKDQLLHFQLAIWSKSFLSEWVNYLNLQQVDHDAMKSKTCGKNNILGFHPKWTIK